MKTTASMKFHLGANFIIDQIMPTEALSSSVSHLAGCTILADSLPQYRKGVNCIDSLLQRTMFAK